MQSMIMTKQVVKGVGVGGVVLVVSSADTSSAAREAAHLQTLNLIELESSFMSSRLSPRNCSSEMIRS